MRTILLFIQLFFALSATACGAALMLAPDGHLLQLPLGVLTNASFEDFFWPGLVLCSTLGLGHAVAFVLALRQAAAAPWVALVAGFASLIWIIVQVIMTDPVFWLQPVIASLGLVEVLGSERLWRQGASVRS